MCGIVGYIGPKQAAPLILEALEKLEYRGYDSSGIAIADGNKLGVVKAKGRLSVLEEMTDWGRALPGSLGIGHTRWATHGEPNDVNAHPHLSQHGEVALVHNGIVENYIELRDFLTEQGYSFMSETDTEIAANLVEHLYRSNREDGPEAAIREALSLISGAFALGIIFADHPDTLYAVRKDSPLIVGVGKGENFIASDVPAILKHTRQVIRLDEYDMAVLTAGSVKIYNRYGEELHKNIEHIQWDADAAEKGGYPHFMLKEIMEQPDVIRSTVRPRVRDGRIDLGLSHISPDDIIACDRIFIVACGSASYVGQVAKHYIERYTRIPVTVELASEFRYSNTIVTDRTIAIVISQSGETIDTLFVLREAKSRGAHVLSIVNVVGSTIANESEDVIYTWAGPEIAVATTKAYSAQLSVCYLLALYMGHCRHMVSDSELKDCLNAIEKLPGLMRGLLEKSDYIKYLASLHFGCRNIYFIGRNIDHALALEGSLKLKEISYIFSEAYPAGELKHGTISLIEPGSLVVALCTYSPLTEKMISNMREVKARGAVVLALATEGTPGVEETADQVMWIPKADPFVLPSLAILPLQLFAYYVALLKGCDIDKPRNLAKSVTVE